MQKIQIWGGIECTLNRVGDEYFDQCEKNGHYRRDNDLSLFASLALKKIRYPCLWEKVAPTNINECNWTFLDKRLNELKKLDISPIAGFLHHGSGPVYTSLIDPEFPEKFAFYVRQFIQRYPWIEDFTPINEINTTARFSCLYGHWYPHLKSDEYYLRALLNQCKATVLAMKEIRKVNPRARFIQTDDMGRTQSTEELKYQSDFENERRWLAFDILCGKLGNHHPLYPFFIKNKIPKDEIDWFQKNSCPPDLIGLNHYLLSNRFLDHQLENYPEFLHGGNGIDKYADVGAVDTGKVEVPNPETIFKETWERYHVPIAVTEVHTCGHRETQMRWLKQIWEAANFVRSQGVELEAITVWSLLGTFNWHNLCTSSHENFYEAGVFDLRNPEKLPRLTALSKMVKSLAEAQNYHAPILEVEGYWKSPRRMLWNIPFGTHSKLNESTLKPILITGGSGTLGRAFARICGARNIPYQILSRKELDISNPDSIKKSMDRYDPWAIINAAGYVRVDEAEEDHELCFRENLEGSILLAQACKDRNIPLMIFSSDLVFNGELSTGYLESHHVSPLNIYGQSKALSEKRVIEIHEKTLIIRTSSFFGPWDEYNFITRTLRKLSEDTIVHAPHDLTVSPTYIPDLVNECLTHLIDETFGIIHLVNQGEVSWSDFAKLALQFAHDKYNFNNKLLVSKSIADLNFKAPRPKNSVLKSERCNLLPPLEDAMKRYFSELEVSIDTKRRLSP